MCSGWISQEESWEWIFWICSSLRLVLKVNRLCCSAAVWAGSRGRSVVFWPHLTWLHLDPTCVSGSHKPSHCGGQCVKQMSDHQTDDEDNDDEGILFSRSFLYREKIRLVFRSLWPTPLEDCQCWWSPSLPRFLRWVEHWSLSSARWFTDCTL